MRAQDVLSDSTNLLPMRTVGVQERPRPEYDPLGIHLGAFQLTPELNIGETYDDNIYATEHDQVGDSLTATTAGLALSTLGTGLSFSSSADVIYNRYLHNTAENYTDFSGSMGVSDTLGRSTSASASAEFARTHVSRQDPSFPSDAISPPGEDSLAGTITLQHSFIDNILDLNAEIESFKYLDAELPENVILSQSFKNRNEVTFDLKDSFLVGRSASAFLHVIHKQYDYSHSSDTTNSNAVSDNAGTGATFEVTNLVKGEIGVGILRLRNHDVKDSHVNTFSVRSNIEFFVTPILTATATVVRSDGPANLLTSSSFIGTTGTFALDYEFRRNVILSGGFARSHRTYTGIDATDNTSTGTAKVRWLLNRSLKLDLIYAHTSRYSPVPQYLGENFKDQTIELEVVLGL